MALLAAGLAQSAPGLAPLAAVAQAQVGVRNGDFEEGKVDEPPSGWVLPTAGYTAVITDDRPYHGEHCARLSSDQKGEAAPFGNLMQSLDATAYRGQRVRLKAAVRVAMAGFEDQAQLWLRVDRAGGQMGFFDNMGDRPIRNARWDTYEIVGDVAPDAESIHFGLMLVRNGRVWLDAVSLETLGAPASAPAEGPRRLKDRGLDNLVAFTRLLGYVRFFHPSNEAAKTNWDDFAINGVRRVEDVQDAPALAQRLEKLFQPIAPTVRVFVGGQPPAIPAELSAPTGAESPDLIAWRHLGAGLGGQSNIYRSWRDRSSTTDGKVPEGWANPAEPLIADLGGGVSCLVPLALWLDGDQTRPPAKEDAAVPSEMPAPTVKSGNDRATRLAAVALTWSVLQHFYPYFDVVQTDWPEALRTALTSAATDADERAFLRTLRRLIAALHDGHGGAYHACDTADATLPLLWDWVENRLVVTRVAASVDTETLKPGDVVLKIDGRDAAVALTDVEQYISGATPQWRRYRSLPELARGAAGTTVALDVAGADGQVRSIKLERVRQSPALQEPRPEKIATLKPGVLYVDIDRINDEDFKKVLPELEKARGIVFDLRGYPRSLSAIVIAHLIDQPVTCAQWHVPIVQRPDRAGVQYQFSNWPVNPEQPRLTAKVAFVTDGRAISYAETYLGIIEHYKLAEIVGGPTAGTNGNVNPLVLPGGYRVSWTGMRVLKHDGSQHHGVGIRPTVPATRTIAGVRAGRDELLEKAIAVVSP